MDTDGKSDSAVIDVVNQFNAPSAHITVSMGHERKGTLAINSVRKVVDKLLGLSHDSGATVRSMRVSGAATETGHMELVDLIEDRMMEKAEIEPDVDRRLPYSRRQEAVHGAWIGRKQELHAMFGEA